jgi:hypothetical protein
VPVIRQQKAPSGQEESWIALRLSFFPRLGVLIFLALLASWPLGAKRTFSYAAAFLRGFVASRDIFSAFGHSDLIRTSGIRISRKCIKNKELH